MEIVKNVVRYLVSFVVAVAAAIVAGVPIFVFGLSVPMYVIWPLTLVVEAAGA